MSGWGEVGREGRRMVREGRVAEKKKGRKETEKEEEKGRRGEEVYMEKRERKGDKEEDSEWKKEKGG